ncbi:hypothetical protein [Streptomyces antarcticus]|uniref:hypothetical protein n=1 Tax=Streptomyces antarcticus TaxID=2996458 RepID=UPI0022718B5D|nr:MULTISPECIES: hypothetical protein [unclassified Streptomyces]MCY0941931.1 hypothetical protein [Streptomyces sp. H34-AA3]MCZ4082797.1 hypothetical protein [Streptomyces sp. H34-S5]
MSRLIDEATGNEIKPGDVVTTFRNEEYKLAMISRPAEGNSTGRVIITRPCGHSEDEHKELWWCRGEDAPEVFPSVINARIEG